MSLSEVGGKGKGKCGSDLFGTGKRNRSMMAFHDCFDEHEAEANAIVARLVGMSESLETLEQARAVDFCDSVSLVGDVAQDLAGRVLQPQHATDASVRGTVIDRIGN